MLFVSTVHAALLPESNYRSRHNLLAYCSCTVWFMFPTFCDMNQTDIVFASDLPLPVFTIQLSSSIHIHT